MLACCSSVECQFQMWLTRWDFGIKAISHATSKDFLALHLVNTPIYSKIVRGGPLPQKQTAWPETPVSRLAGRTLTQSSCRSGKAEPANGHTTASAEGGARPVTCNP